MIFSFMFVCHFLVGLIKLKNRFLVLSIILFVKLTFINFHRILLDHVLIQNLTTSKSADHEFSNLFNKIL